MWEIIKVPFGYLLDWLCQFCGSYGLALILFTLVLKVILLPMSMKSKKSMLKMSRLAPQLKQLEIECGDDKQKYQQEASKLYKSEGVSMFGGCLWSFVPLLILIPLYAVIREPIQYMLHFSKENAQQIVDAINAVHPLASNQYYQQLEAAAHLSQYRDVIAAALPDLDLTNLRQINFQFLGLDLSQVPSYKFWTFGGAALGSQIAMFILPLISAASQVFSSWVGQKMNNRVVTDENGERDAEAAKTANQSGKTMMYMMPLLSLYFCFIMPAAMSIYWIAQALLGTLQDVVLTNHYRKIYDEEDELKQARAKALAEKEAERERIRAERREKYGEEGIQNPNTSKKKLKQQAAAEQKAAADAYMAAQAAEQEPDDVTEDKHFSGDPERPYCRGRAYKPNRYGRKDSGKEEKQE